MGELNTNNCMIQEEKYMHNFNNLEQEFEKNTNNDMIQEEEYLRKIYKELNIMETSERKLMAYNEWQQREGRKNLRNVMRSEILREAKRRLCYKKAWKMYIFFLFVLKAKQIIKEKKKFYYEKLARKTSMRHA